MEVMGWVAALAVHAVTAGEQAMATIGWTVPITKRNKETTTIASADGELRHSANAEAGERRF